MRKRAVNEANCLLTDISSLEDPSSDINEGRVNPTIFLYVLLFQNFELLQNDELPLHVTKILYVAFERLRRGCLDAEPWFLTRHTDRLRIAKSADLKLATCVIPCAFTDLLRCRRVLDSTNVLTPPEFQNCDVDDILGSDRRLSSCVYLYRGIILIKSYKNIKSVKQV